MEQLKAPLGGATTGSTTTVDIPDMSKQTGEIAANENKAKKNTADGRFSGTTITIRIGDVDHKPSPCSGAALVPFEERIGLWRERFGRVTGNPNAVAGIYRSALASCEAPTWRERSKLVSLMLDAMPTVSAKVSLWRVMFTDLGVADALYRGMLARVRTATEVRELHAALGLQTIDPGVLE